MTAMGFDDETSRKVGEATEAAQRKILVLLELLRKKSIRFSTYSSVYSRDFRSFQRDLQHLRRIGEEGGFTISAIRNKELANLTVSQTELPSLEASPRIISLIGALGGALGAPVERELGGIGVASPDAGFLRLLQPVLVAQTRIGEIYDLLRKAWDVRPGPAIVRFDYDPGKGARSTRRVEPYRVLMRSGSAYLVAYDLDKRAWRIFAIDRFCSLPQRAGTILNLRTVPAQYESTDTIGFFKSGNAVKITVELSPTVAASATSRRWQAAQTVEVLDGGAARITFEVSDVGEVVRWALGFGKEARVVAPPSAVELAIETVGEIAATYRA
jgi:predicted DNA-binding transcriptional regulator YafY